MKDLNDIELILKDLKDNAKEEFQLPKGYFDEMSADLKLKLFRTKNEEFSVPSDYHEQKKNELKDISELKLLPKSPIRLKRVWYAVGSVAAILLLFFVLNLKRAEECVSFACLLEETEITIEDIEYFEEYEETGFYLEEEY